MLFKVSAHLKKLSLENDAIKKQFYISDNEEKDHNNCEDPLLEEKFTKVKGLVHKYDNRVLILLTLNCAAYCRFCTRRRSVSDLKKGQIGDKELDDMVLYIKKHAEIKEVIISGGDPISVPSVLKKALYKFSIIPQIKVIRIGTRVPVSDPKLINNDLIKILKIVKRQSLYVLIHFEHPKEITKETIKAIIKLKKTGAMIFSQSVFLKGVNDSYEVLYDLFSGLIEIGVKPYYLFRCDPVRGAEHFIVPLEKEVEIATKLRKNLSGIACPVYTIDTPDGSGKIPVPLNFWKYNRKQYVDFNDELINS